MKTRLITFLTKVFTGARGETKAQRTIAYLTWAAITVAIVASVMSALGICSGGCTDAEKYRFFGARFATLGIPFFLLLGAASLSRNSKRTGIRFLYDTLLPGVAGAEWFFLGIQDRIIKHYCPVCLAIAIAVFVAVALRLAELYLRSREGAPSAKKSIKGVAASFVKVVMIFAWMYAGLVVAIVGTSSPVMAGSGAITQDIWLGKADSNVEVLVVSDWFCPYCRTTEPTIDKMLPAIGKVARYSFIDDPIHEESYNFIPANMSLLLNSKSQYIEGRKALLELAEHNKSPKNEEVLAALKKHGINLTFLAPAALKQLARSEAGFIRANLVTMTPTVVVRNRKTGTHKLLMGTTEITEEKVAAAVTALVK